MKKKQKSIQSIESNYTSTHFPIRETNRKKDTLNTFDTCSVCLKEQAIIFDKDRKFCEKCYKDGQVGQGV